MPDNTNYPFMKNMNMQVAKNVNEAPPNNFSGYPAVNTTFPPYPTTIDKKTTGKKSGKAAPRLRLSASQTAEARRLQMQCRQLCASVFLEERTAVRSLGFTSAIDGEGKTFLAMLAAVVLATDLHIPVTLLECNWEHPCFNDIFGLEHGPGLAEWIRGECALHAIRRPVNGNLTVICAGNDRQEIIRLLKHFRHRGVLEVLGRPDEVLIVDLPSVVTTAYGQLAASIVESLIMVVRMGVTHDLDVAEASTYLKNLHVHGMVFNQVKSHMPRWLAQIF